MKKTILIFIGSYLPSQSSGGAIRTIVNMVEYLGDEFNFKIITRDRDSGDNKPFDNIKLNEWNDAKHCKVFYKTKNQALRTVINNTEFDTYYLNSFFDFHFSIKVIILKYFGLIKKKQMILAPRGEFGEGVLKSKTLKKRAYIRLAKIFHIYNNIIWHASTEIEADNIKREMGKKINYKTAIDIPDYSLLTKNVMHRIKEIGFLKILFLSVIAPNKNLKFAIEVLNKVSGDFIFDIYGPIRDEQYWKECLDAINPKIRDKITYKGEINNSEIQNVYPNYDLFFFPTLGENFGHVVWESLALGCPVLTTHTTPWNGLQEHNAGWNIDLKDADKIKAKIEELIKIDENNYTSFIYGCSKYINSLDKKVILNDNYKLFEN